jgi:signal transduction histidine kinase/CheY-like chemotaxis protein
MKSVRSLRWHLVQVLLAGILPLGLFAAVLLFLHWKAQDEQRRNVQLETTRLLAAAVDNALDSSVQRLAILSRQLATRPGNEAELYETARIATAGSPDWENMLAFRADGKGVFRLDRPFGAAIPTMKLRTYSATALNGNRPAISPLFVNATTGTKVIGVAHPVERNGRVSHVLIASLNLRWFDELLARHAMPEGGIAGIFDAQMKFVARSHDAEVRRGADPAPDLHADMQRVAEGIGRYPSLDGRHVYTSWTRTRHGWWVAVAAPAAPIDGGLWRTMWALGALLVLAVLIGVAFAGLKGRQITSSLAVLGQRAGELARGRALQPAARSPVAEIEQSLQALDSASTLLERARLERDGLLEAEQRARSAAERANRAKDEFLAMLGHELRNPLAAVSNAAAVIRSGQRTGQQLDFASGVIERQTRHLKRLIDDLLDVGRVINGKIRLDRRPIELQASVQHVLATLRAAGSLARHRVEVDTRPVWVNGDQTRLEQVITNLLVNAATHTPAGGAIGIALEEARGEARLQVWDSGAGIAPEEQARIFELFYQSVASRERGGGGLGIGLTLVKRLVELHEGTVEVASEGEGRGAAFTVRIPTVVAPVATEPAAAARASAQTVLIVEDNEDERESLRMALELEGHRVLQAADARSALAEVRAGKPNVAFIDIGLPGADGYALAQAIRAEHGERVALFALTGFGAPADVQRARQAGFRAHLTKPVAVNELAAIVARAVS